MSADATAHVWKHSPYEGKPFIVHLAIADVVNDTHDWQFYGGIKALTSKCRVARRTVIDALAKMVDDGHLERIGIGPNGTTSYRFVFVGGGATIAPGGATISARGCNPPHPRLLPTKEELKVEDETSPRVDSLNALLAQRYATFAGTPLTEHKTTRWRTDMRLLLERGPTNWADPAAIPAEAVERRINGIFDRLVERDRGGFCWASQIRSPGALRKHWDQITVEAGKLKSPRRVTPRQHTADEDEPWMDRSKQANDARSRAQ